MLQVCYHLVAMVILLCFPLYVTAKGSRFSQVIHVFDLISSQNLFYQAFCQSSNRGLQINFLFLKIMQFILLHFEDCYSYLLFSSSFQVCFVLGKCKFPAFIKSRWYGETIQFRICAYYSLWAKWFHL